MTLTREQIEDLRRVLAELEKDAERYRWLRNPRRTHMVTVEQFGDVRSTLFEKRLDAAIDAALAKGKPHD